MLLYFTKTKERKILLKLREKSIRVSVTDGYFLTLEIFRFDNHSSCIINVLSFMFKILFDSVEVLEPFFFLLVKLTSLMMQAECLVPESTIRVLRDDCSCTENLVGSWVQKFALERGASFFRRRDVFRREE